MEKRDYGKNRAKMNTFVSTTKPIFYSGWKSALFRLKFGISSCKYIFQRNKYPLFLISSLKLTKNQGLPGKIKIAKFANQYYGAILRVPRWPSKAFDYMVANGGFNINAAGTPLKKHVDSAILAITRKCNYSCEHCYEYSNIGEKESVPVERWKEVVRELQKLGVGIIVFSGGEPMLRYREMLELLESGDKNLSDFHIHTSGHEVTLEKAKALKTAGLTAAAVALDDFDQERHDDFRGHKGAFKESIHAIQYFRDAGVFPYINMCLRKELIRSNSLGKYFEFVKDLNVGSIVLLEPKPWGRYVSENAEDLFSEKDRKAITKFFKETSQSKKNKDYPLVFYIQYFERPEHLGCLMGGLSHLYIDSLGNVQPCVFLPVSFGNIVEEDFIEIYKRMRKAVSGPLHKQCPSLYLSEKIKNKRSQERALPIPYMEIKKEWEQMFA